MKVDAPPVHAVRVRLELPDDRSSGAIRGRGPQLKAAVGAEFSFKMKPSGEIENIKIPEATLKKLREGLPATQGEQEAFSEQALKEHGDPVEPASVPARSRSKPGKSWSSKPNRIPLPTGNARPRPDRSRFRAPIPRTPSCC